MKVYKLHYQIQDNGLAYLTSLESAKNSESSQSIAPQDRWERKLITSEIILRTEIKRKILFLEKEYSWN